MAINIDKLAEFMKNHTNKEAAIYFSVSERTISRTLKKYNLSYYDLKYGDFDPSLFPTDAIVGSLLGDGMIDKTNRFRFGQTVSRKEYVAYIYDNLKPLSKNFFKETSKNKKTNKIYYSWRMYTCRHNVFKCLREKWYPNGGKIIPRDLKLTPIIFAHWMVQDGSNNQSKKSFRLSTNCFKKDDVKFLIEILKRDLNIISTMNFQKEQPTIHIGAYEYLKTMSLLKPLVIWDCFKYKIDISKVAVKMNSNLGSCKLDLKKAKEIRRLYNKDFSMSKIADLFDVSVTSISNVINEKTYKSFDTAIVNVEYRP